MPASVASIEQQPKRGGQRKLALAEEEDKEEVSEKVEEAVAPPEQVEKVEAPAKKGGRRKAVPALEEVAVAAPAPVKRGRRGAATVEEKKEEVEVKISPVKRGRKATVEKAEL